MIKRNADYERALAEVGHFHGPLDAVFSERLTQSSEWPQFAASWDDLPTDQYMADQGRYRQRRYGEFRLSSGASVEELATNTYRQSKSVNYLNGDIDRLYEPIRTEIKRHEIFRCILLRFHALLAATHTGQPWRVQVFQNRIIAATEELGRPTPEGVHRDGVDYVLTLLVRRCCVGGGKSLTYCAASGLLLSEVTLREPGDFIFLDDNRVMHAVEPITPVGPTALGHRDVLIAMFSAAR